MTVLASASTASPSEASHQISVELRLGLGLAAAPAAVPRTILRGVSPRISSCGATSTPDFLLGLTGASDTRAFGGLLVLAIGARVVCGEPGESLSPGGFFAKNRRGVDALVDAPGRGSDEDDEDDEDVAKCTFAGDAPALAGAEWPSGHNFLSSCDASLVVLLTAACFEVMSAAPTDVCEDTAAPSERAACRSAPLGPARCEETAYRPTLSGPDTPPPPPVVPSLAATAPACLDSPYSEIHGDRGPPTA